MSNPDPQPLTPQEHVFKNHERVKTQMEAAAAELAAPLSLGNSPPAPAPAATTLTTALATAPQPVPGAPGACPNPKQQTLNPKP
jgi:hypothetical protein